MKTVSTEFGDVELEIWDTAGQGVSCLSSFYSISQVAQAHTRSTRKIYKLILFLCLCSLLVSLLVFFACFFVSVFFLHFFVCFGYPFYLALCTETYRSISALYYRGAAIILLVYDITNKVLLINWIGKSARFVILCDYGLIACGSFFAFLRDSCAGVFAPS